jgi:hypothetical protein
VPQTSKIAARWALLALGISALPSYAATLQIYSDQTLFNQQLSVYSTVTFENIVSAPGYVNDYDDLSGFTDPATGVQFVGINDPYSPYLAIEWPSASQTDQNWGTGAYLLGPYYGNLSTQYVEITLPNPAYAVGMDLMTQTPYGGSYSITLSTGDTISPIATQNLPTPTWFGVISDTPITSLRVEVLSGHSNIDNFEFGSPLGSQTDTPEAATFILIGSGLLGLRLVKRRRRRRLNPSGSAETRRLPGAATVC